MRRMAYRVKLRFFCISVVILAFAQGDHCSRVSAQGRPTDPHRADLPGATYRGGLVTPPLPKPRFTLTDTSGAAFEFWRETEGMVTLLFFGYTRCPDECPLHMSNISMGLKKMPAGLSDHVALVF